jgi:uncharacterized protein YndB with AHSA1/START domain/DNA-binding transcriptional ArsR family regulator
MDHLSAAAADVWSGQSTTGSEPAGNSDAVFKALADPSRRLLLDSLFVEDGQTLGELTVRLPEMSRFGVMKHLRLLEAAGLVATRRVGREKLHYLNPVPIRLIHDRWIGKYAEPWVGALADLKVHLEGAVMAMDRPRHVFQIFIRATPEQLWQAITDPSFTVKYLLGSRVESSWLAGTGVAYWIDEELVVDGLVIEADPPRRLVQTWSFRVDPELRDDPPSRVTWEIEPIGDTCKLTLVHDHFASETRTYRRVSAGWWLVLSSLKSLLETGEGLNVPLMR